MNFDKLSSLALGFALGFNVEKERYILDGIMNLPLVRRCNLHTIAPY